MKKIICLFLCLVMIAGMLPGSLAEDIVPDIPETVPEAELLTWEEINEVSQENVIEEPQPQEQEQISEIPEENPVPEEPQEQQEIQEQPIPELPEQPEIQEMPVEEEKQPEVKVLKVPDQKQFEFYYTGNEIDFRDGIENYGQNWEDFLFVDGSDFMTNVPKDPDKGTFKTLAELMQESGCVYGDKATEYGDYYFIIIPAGVNVFEDPNCWYEIYEFLIVPAPVANVEEQVEEISEEPAEEQAEEISEEPAEEQVEEIFEEPAEEQVEEISEEPIKEQIAEISEEPAEEQVEEISEEPAKEQVEAISEEPAEEQVEEISEEPEDEQAEEISEKSAEEQAEEISEEPAEEQAEEISEESEEEQVEEVTETPANEQEEIPTVKKQIKSIARLENSKSLEEKQLNEKNITFSFVSEITNTGIKVTASDFVGLDDGFTGSLEFSLYDMNENLIATTTVEVLENGVYFEDLPCIKEHFIGQTLTAKAILSEDESTWEQIAQTFIDGELVAAPLFTLGVNCDEGILTIDFDHLQNVFAGDAFTVSVYEQGKREYADLLGIFTSSALIESNPAPEKISCVLEDDFSEQKGKKVDVIGTISYGYDLAVTKELTYQIPRDESEYLRVIEKYSNAINLRLSDANITEYAEEGNLFGLFEDEYDATLIAELYEIELISFSEGKAIFATEENPKSVIEIGKKNGWPELNENLAAEGYTPQKANFTNSVELVSETAFEGFTGVYMDGALLDENNYEAYEGSTHVKLNKDYIKTLSAGSHLLSLVFGSRNSNDVELVIPEFPSFSIEASIEANDVTVKVKDMKKIEAGDIFYFTILDKDEQIVAESIENINTDPVPESFDKLIPIEAETYKGQTLKVVVSLERDGEQQGVKETTFKIIDPEAVDFDAELTINNLHVAMADKSGKEVLAIDKVDYRNLEAGVEYTLNYDLYILEDNELGKQLISGSNTFQPEAASGTEELRFKLNTANLEGETIVALVELEKDKEIIVEHKETDNDLQMVRFTQLMTLLTDKDGNKVIKAGQVTLVDSIAYANLLPNKSYKVEARLISNGNIITETEQTTILNPSESFGVEEIKYIFDASPLVGKSATSYIRIYLDDVLVAAHEEENDPDQTVSFPGIATFASNGNGGKEIPASSKAAVIDIINYTGLKPNTEYVVFSSLVDENGQEVYLTNGTKVTSSFFSKTGTGSATVIIPVNAAAHAGKSLTVFEEIYCDGVLVAEHKDRSDADQTVKVPKTAAVYNYDITTNTPLLGSEITVRDLITGTEYNVTTDSKGIGYAPLTAGHQYSIKQKSVKEGYVLNSNTYYFTVPTSGELNKVNQTIYNYPVGTAVIKKTDLKTGAPVEGATVTIYNNGGIVATLKTDARGQIYFDASKYIKSDSANFTYKETAAPQGYYINNATYSFTVSKEGKASGSLNFVDCPYGTVMITKTNKEGKPLSGARISVYTAQGRMIGQATTNVSGHIYLAVPEAGSYYFIEDKAPEGYARVDQKFTFSVDSYGRVTGTTSFVNEVSGKGKGVQTGDTADIFWYSGLAVAALAVVIFLSLESKRDKKKKAELESKAEGKTEKAVEPEQHTENGESSETKAEVNTEKEAGTEMKKESSD